MEPGMWRNSTGDTQMNQTRNRGRHRQDNERKGDRWEHRWDKSDITRQRKQSRIPRTQERDYRNRKETGDWHGDMDLTRRHKG